MHLQNYTPFCGLSWKNIDPRGQMFITTLCRVKFVLKRAETRGEWRLQVAKDQGEPFIQDIHYDEDNNSSVRYESDFVPYKAHTDIVVNAKSYNIFAERNWLCSVAVQDVKEKTINYSSLNINNEYFAKKKEYIDVRYENCKGGILDVKHPHTKEEERIYDPYNPVGCGKYTENSCRVQIDYGDKPLEHIPPGFSFVHRSWKSRLDYTGTYDKQWEEMQAPLLPVDFDAYHYQAAHPKLVTKEYLKGGEKIILTQLMKENYQNSFKIPTFRFLSRIHTSTQIIHAKMNLDTLIIDIYDENEESYAVYASWRSQVKIYDEGLHTELIYVPNKEEESV